MLLFISPLTTSAQDGPANNVDEYEKQYAERITKDRLYGTYIPKNLDDALNQLDKLISENGRETIKAFPEDSVYLYLHGRLGQWIIMNWGFYGGSRMSHYLRSAGVTYPDDMADLIILAYHKRLHGKPIVIKELILHFKNRRNQLWLEKIEDKEVIMEEKVDKGSRYWVLGIGCWVLGVRC